MNKEENFDDLLNTMDYSTHIASISVNADINRESINELGRRAPYFKSVSFPLDVLKEDLDCCLEPFSLTAQSFITDTSIEYEDNLDFLVYDPMLEFAKAIAEPLRHCVLSGNLYSNYFKVEEIKEGQ